MKLLILLQLWCVPSVWKNVGMTLCLDLVTKCIILLLNSYWLPPKGGQRCLKSQGCHLSPLSYLLSCFSAQSSCSFCLIIFLLMVPSPDFSFEKTLKQFPLRVRLFCMALVEQLGDDSWQVVCAACCLMALAFAIMCLYNVLLVPSIPLKKNL